MLAVEDIVVGGDLDGVTIESPLARLDLVSDAVDVTLMDPIPLVWFFSGGFEYRPASGEGIEKLEGISSDAKKLQELHERIQEMEKKIHDKYERWAELEKKQRELEK